MEKLIYALVVSTQKLRPYFKSHSIEFVTSYPLRAFSHKLDLTVHMALWVIEFGAFDLRYVL